MQGPQLGGKEMNSSPGHTTGFGNKKDKDGKMEEADMIISRNIY